MLEVACLHDQPRRCEQICGTEVQVGSLWKKLVPALSVPSQSSPVGLCLYEDLVLLSVGQVVDRNTQAQARKLHRMALVEEAEPHMNKAFDHTVPLA